MGGVELGGTLLERWGSRVRGDFRRDGRPDDSSERVLASYMKLTVLVAEPLLVNPARFSV